MADQWGDSVRKRLRQVENAVERIDLAPRLDQVGTVLSAGDGVALVGGLPGITVGELVTFENGTSGQVLDLGADAVGCAVLGPTEGVAAGSRVVPAGTVVTAPVGQGVLGRMIDPLGTPLDDEGPLAQSARVPIDRDAPGPLQRQPIREPLFTGIKAVDAAVPIGRGQRELILGDRETGKTAIALDAIIAQRSSGVACVYVVIGAERSSIVEVWEELRRNDARQHTVMVVADAAQPPALRYLAPYTGAAIAEWFAYAGGPALVVYDDLTRHAEAYRSLSLILRRPPGREAFPGDIFSIHAQLLERSFKLSDELGAGSVTALPIIETQRGNISDFIPTNLISITDGQLFLDASLFTSGQLPAVDLGRSVSRVGGDAQPGYLRAVSGSLRLEAGQYEEVKGFARFSALLDDSTKRQLSRGQRLMAVLRQEERHLVDPVVQAAELWALNKGSLDEVDVERVPEFERELGAASEGALRALGRVAEAAAEPTEDDFATWTAKALSSMG